ncbi:unnamed protein product, partial [Prorocentrum cordatum]
RRAPRRCPASRPAAATARPTKTRRGAGEAPAAEEPRGPARARDELVRGRGGRPRQRPQRVQHHVDGPERGRKGGHGAARAAVSPGLAGLPVGAAAVPHGVDDLAGHARLRGRLRRVRVPGAGRAGWLLAEAAEQPAPARAAAGTRRLRQGEGVSPEDDGVEGLGRVARRRGDQRAPFDASSSASPAEGLHWTAEAQRPRPGAASGGGARAPAVGGGSPVVPAVLRAPLSDPPPRGSAEAPRAAADARGSARQTWCDLHLGARQSPGALGRCQEVADEEEDEEDRTGAGGRPGLRAAPQALR